MSTVESPYGVAAPAGAPYHLARHPHHARLHCFELSAGDLRSFLAATEKITVQELEYLPLPCRQRCRSGI